MQVKAMKNETILVCIFWVEKDTPFLLTCDVGQMLTEGFSDGCWGVHRANDFSVCLCLCQGLTGILFQKKQ